jgi:hypothetical protein
VTAPTACIRVAKVVGENARVALIKTERAEACKGV